MSIIFCIKGASATGKSTRTKFLLDFLFSKGLDYEPLLYKDYKVGIYYKSLNFAVIGKYYKKNDEERFQGYDSMTSKLKASELSNFLKENNDKNFLIEGAGITDTYRLRPKFLLNELRFSKVVIIYFNYSKDQKDKYLDRVFKRNGKYPNKDSGWNKYKNYQNDALKALEEASNFNEDKYNILYKNYDENKDFILLTVLIELNNEKMLCS